MVCTFLKEKITHLLPASQWKQVSFVYLKMKTDLMFAFWLKVIPVYVKIIKLRSFIFFF